jgi:hypothetical protein
MNIEVVVIYICLLSGHKIDLEKGEAKWYNIKNKELVPFSCYIKRFLTPYINVGPLL